MFFSHASYRGLGEIDGLQSTCLHANQQDLCAGQLLRRPKPVLDKSYVRLSLHVSLGCLLGQHMIQFVAGP